MDQRKTIEFRNNQGARMKGNQIWLGRSHTAESRAKMSAAAQGRGGPSNPNFKHGHGGTTTRSPTYSSWYNMVSRCTTKSNKQYGYYGGRGIEIYPAWLWFEQFLEDMGEKPEGMSLDRIDNDGHYMPWNCRWLPVEEQSANRRPYSRWKHCETCSCSGDND